MTFNLILDTCQAADCECREDREPLAQALAAANLELGMALGVYAEHLAYMIKNLNARDRRIDRLRRAAVRMRRQGDEAIRSRKAWDNLLRELDRARELQAGAAVTGGRDRLEARVKELEKTLWLIPGADNPRSPQDVMEYVAHFDRLELELSEARKEVENLRRAQLAKAVETLQAQIEQAKRADKDCIWEGMYDNQRKQSDQWLLKCEAAEREVERLKAELERLNEHHEVMHDDMDRAERAERRAEKLESELQELRNEVAAKSR